MVHQSKIKSFDIYKLSDSDIRQFIYFIVLQDIELSINPIIIKAVLLDSHFVTIKLELFAFKVFFLQIGSRGNRESQLFSLIYHHYNSHENIEVFQKFEESSNFKSSKMALQFLKILK